MKKTKDSLLVLSVAIVLCVLRYIIRDSKYILDIMAVFNLFALNYSVWCMFNDAEEKLMAKNAKSSIGKEQLKKNIKFFNRLRTGVEMALFVVCSLFYLCIAKSGTANDMLTIIALCFALETTNFSSKLANFCYKRT